MKRTKYSSRSNFRSVVSGNDIVNYIICGYLVDKGFRVGVILYIIFKKIF